MFGVDRFEPASCWVLADDAKCLYWLGDAFEMLRAEVLNIK
jgi:hypothetical protein